MSCADIKIMIVDDIPANVSVLDIMLNKEGFTTIIAESGKKALDLAEKEHPTLILLDIMMPEMDGYEVCQKLKTNEVTRDIPVIFVSAKDAAEDKVKGLKLGAVDFISKPFDKFEVMARVRVHLSLELTKMRLTESEKNYEDLLENIHEGELLWDPSGIIFANSAFFEITRTSQENIYSTDITDLIYTGYKDMFSKMLQDTLDDKNVESKKAVEIYFVGANGEKIICSCYFNTATFFHKKCVRVSINDMTERLELERQLAHAQKMEAVGSLTSGIAHDFNNVLALINGYTELTMLEAGKDSPMYEKLQIILDAGKKAVSMTRGLLSFGRKKSMIFSPVNLNNEIKEVHSFMSRSLPKIIDFQIFLPDNPIAISADSGMIQQVLVNLCINARDAMLRGGDLKIVLEVEYFKKVPLKAPEGAEPGKYAKICVIDNGTGIPVEIMEKIYNPFFTTKKAGKGSGLGLSMVTRIIRNHNGWTEVVSEENKGTTFCVYIPTIEDLIESQEMVPCKRVPKEHLKDVLVVDSDKVHAAMAESFLSQAGYIVNVSYSREEALEYFNSGADVNLMIVDHKMPDMNGVKLAEIVNEKYPETKVIVTAADGNVPTTANLLLRKPFTATELFSSFERL